MTVLALVTRIIVNFFDILPLDPVRSEEIRYSIFTDHFFREFLNRLGTYMSSQIPTISLARVFINNFQNPATASFEFPINVGIPSPHMTGIG